MSYLGNLLLMTTSPSTSDVICALATPPGVAGLAVIRVSGDQALELCHPMLRSSRSIVQADSHTILYGWWRSGDRLIDSVTCSVFKAPNSYTGENTVEIGCHGGLHVVDQIISSLLAGGVRLAEPGEFTKRAFLNKKLDLTQVEAVADLIASRSRIGAQTAARQLAGGFTHRLATIRQQLLDSCALLELELDFSEEDVEFVDKAALAGSLGSVRDLALRLADSASSAEMLRSGFYCAVVGYPNAGKSSLFNALLSRSRAIVSDVPGTTRDYLEETIFVDGYAIRLYDTAGLRETTDSIELQGIHITSSLIEQSDLVIIVNDPTQGFDHSDLLADDIRTRFPGHSILLVHTKADLLSDTVVARPDDVLCSSQSLDGISDLRERLRDVVATSTSGIDDVLVNSRQAALLRVVIESVDQAMTGISMGLSNEFITVDVRSAIRALGDITGESWNGDVLETIFSRFCIGK